MLTGLDLDTGSSGVASYLDARAVVQVMQGMLGQWSKEAGAGHHARSRLATAIAQNGLADKFMSFNTSYHDTGLFGVYAQTSDPSQLEDLGWCMMQVRPPAPLCSCSCG